MPMKTWTSSLYEYHTSIACKAVLFFLLSYENFKQFSSSFHGNWSPHRAEQPENMSFQVKQLGLLSQPVHLVQLLQGKTMVAICSGRFPTSQHIFYMNFKTVYSYHCSSYAFLLKKEKKKKQTWKIDQLQNRFSLSSLISSRLLRLCFL